jgi:2-dehydropantoate 2-reductase
MSKNNKIYILGAGAIGLALAAHLVNEGKKVVLVRTSTSAVARDSIEITLKDCKQMKEDVRAKVSIASLSSLTTLNGIVVVTTKTYANELIAKQLKDKGSSSPIVLMQNGIGIEKPYFDAGFKEIYRCVLYATSQKSSDYEVRFRMIKSSPVGIIEGNEDQLRACVDQLSTQDFTFHAEPNIQEEIWKKGIINAVFNTICPLLEVDNGIFYRNKGVAEIANEVIGECVGVAHALGLKLNQQELMEQVLNISKGADGQLISTLQDILNHRETEIDTLNLEIARVAESLPSKIDVSKTKLLGELIQVKSTLHKTI